MAFHNLTSEVSGSSPTLESVYPYTSGATGDDSTDCLYSASKATNIKVKSFSDSYWSDGYGLPLVKARVVQQPVAIAITANNLYIHSYASGVIDAGDCYDGK